MAENNTFAVFEREVLSYNQRGIICKWREEFFQAFAENGQDIHGIFLVLDLRSMELNRPIAQRNARPPSATRLK